MPKIIHGAAVKCLPLYRVYISMKARCYSKKQDMYQAYGGRGISVCDEWLESPMSFVEWGLGNGYRKGLTIDRIDVNGNYHPDNCRFVDQTTQARNRRYNRMLTFNGETKCMEEWSKITGISSANIQVRIDRCGWSVERALSEKPIERKQLYSYGGQSLSINDWAKMAGVSPSTISRRIKNGQSLSAPPVSRENRWKAEV